MIVPTTELPPETPFTVHITEVFDPAAVAVKICAPPVTTVAIAGETVTPMLADKVTVAVALACGSALLTAVTVTVVPVGRIPGARYRPAVEIAPEVELPPATPFTSQMTFVFELPVTVA
jgi:ABC-type Fe3+-hydroxamate transport system substrate-binding protein